MQASNAIYSRDDGADIELTKIETNAQCAFFEEEFLECFNKTADEDSKCISLFHPILLPYLTVFTLYLWILDVFQKSNQVRV